MWVRLLPEAPSRTPIAQRKSTALRRQRTLVRFQPGVLHADVAHSEERRSATPERPVRSGPSASQARGVTGSIASSNLAGPGSSPGGSAFTESSRAGAARLPLGERWLSDQRRAVRHRYPTAFHDRDFSCCCGPATLPLSTPHRQVAGSNPARSAACSGSSVVEQFGRHTTTAADRSSAGQRGSVTAHPRAREAENLRPETRVSAGSHTMTAVAFHGPDRDGSG